jgi:hypothetical protein
MWFICSQWIGWLHFDSQWVEDVALLIFTPVIGLSIYPFLAWLLKFPEILLATDKLIKNRKK